MKSRIRGKRRLSFLLAALLLVCSIGTDGRAFAASGREDGFREAQMISDGQDVSSVSGNEIKIEGETGIGRLIANELLEEITEQEAGSGFNVFSVQVEDNAALVSLESVEDSTLVLGIYDEEGKRMLASGSCEVAAGETEAVVEIETEEMPQYFYIRSFLVDTVTYMPLCHVCESPMYTREMQEFLKKTTADFDADRVLNLDEDETNNFAVYAEDTIRIPKEEGNNEVALADEENSIYVLENADSTVLSLQEGDVFAYSYAEDDVLIVRVASVSVDGTTVTITGADTSMEEVFEYIKIDTEMGTGQASVDASTCDEGVTYEGLVEYAEEDGRQGFALEPTGTIERAVDLKLDKEFGKIDGLRVKLYGGLNLKVAAVAKVYLSAAEQYVEIRLDYSAKLSASITGKARAEIPLVTLGFMFYGVIIEVTPSIVLEAKAEISVSGTLSGKVGFRAEVGHGMTNLTTAPKFNASLKVEGSIFLGLSLEPRIKILSEKVASTGLEAKVGVELKATLSDPLSHEEGVKHACKVCIAGEIYGKFSISANLKLVNKWKFSLDLLDKKVKISDSYYSLDKGEYGFSTCPYFYYRLNVAVVDMNSLFVPIPDAAILGVCDDKECVTDDKGNAEIWLQAGKYTMCIKKEGYASFSTKCDITNKGRDLKIGLFRKGGATGGSGGSGGVIGGDEGGGEGGSEIQNKGVHTVSLGKSTSAAITENGDLYLWGANKYGQIGDGTTEDRYTPVKVMERVKEVSLGGGHSAAITEEGDLYLWGWNYYGQIGDGTETNSHTPVKVMEGVKEVNLGDSHSAAITENGDLYLWGLNWSGQLGDGKCGSVTVNNNNGYELNRSTPVKIMEGVKKISLGMNHSAAITERGDLYLWGYNNYGRIGDGTTEDRYTPVKVMERVKEVSLGGEHSAAIMEEGDLYLWGGNYKGQIGDGTEINSHTPVKVMEGVKEVNLGDSHSAAITENGDLYLWGLNWSGQLGDGKCGSVTVNNNNGYELNRSTPVKVMEVVREVSLGDTHSAAISERGDLYLWGGKDYGQIGDGTTENKLTPTKITLPSGNSKQAGVFGATTPSALPDEELSAAMSLALPETWDGTGFTGLMPDEVYNYYVMRDSRAEQPFLAENLLYIGQAVSDGNGSLNVSFTPREEDEEAEIFAVPMHPMDISGASAKASDLTYNGGVQYAPLNVTYQGTALSLGTDYDVEGDYGVTQAGSYRITVQGKGLYTGTLTASYRMKMPRYTVQFDGNGAAQGSMDALADMEYGKAYALPQNRFVRPGYGFAGWNIAADGSGASYADTAQVKDLTDKDGGTVTLYACWRANAYTVRFDGNGATGGSMAQMPCEYGKEYTLAANAYIRPGYTFAGWDTKADGTGTSFADGAAVKDLTETADGVVTLYAKWRETAHIYDGGKVVKEATCAQEGVRAFTCTLCGHVETEAIAKKEHAYKTTVTKATVKKDGETVRKCTACGETETETIRRPDKVTLSKEFYVYSGKARKPSVTVTDSGKKQIPAQHYTVSYTDNKSVGKATVTVTFKGDYYSGKMEAVYYILPKPVSSFSLSAKSKGFSVKWKKQAQQTSGYEIQYSTGKKFAKSGTKTVTIKKNSITGKAVTKLKAKKKYYVRIRTYKTVSKKKYYSAWSAVKSVTTKK